jgi:hypothetical protein
VHLVGFTIEIYYEAQPYERQNLLPCPGIEPLSLGHAARSIVTKLTELSKDRGLDSEQLAFVEQILEREKKRYDK